MNPLSTTRTLHPVQWVAAVAVTIFALVGIGAITGVLPTSTSAESAVAKASIETPPAVATEPASVHAAPVVSAPAATESVAEIAAPPQPKPAVKRAAVKHKPAQVAHVEPASELPPTPPQPAAKICDNCGTVENVQRVEHEGDGSGVGAVTGGVVGGLLGNNVGRGNGRTVATIAGVVGGAMLGNKVEKTRKKTVSYQTTVRFNNGETQVFDNPYEQGFHQGQRVRVVNGALQPE